MHEITPIFYQSEYYNNTSEEEKYDTIRPSLNGVTGRWLPVYFFVLHVYKQVLQSYTIFANVLLSEILRMRILTQPKPKLTG